MFRLLVHKANSVLPDELESRASRGLVVAICGLRFHVTHPPTRGQTTKGDLLPTWIKGWRANVTQLESSAPDGSFEYSSHAGCDLNGTGREGFET
ncbi:hypothetical protein AVEN_213785-1 [Araneus ventricosus]|uniref:Uncharacterized protein n=1 Tax=Araneus ventricosus TaxID=182803 RepID=A0A4Y2K920_ARAVE|nr:hypothetical protein AVEN_213785-1 [Araneus ventricosus]